MIAWYQLLHACLVRYVKKLICRNETCVLPTELSALSIYSQIGYQYHSLRVSHNGVVV